MATVLHMLDGSGLDAAAVRDNRVRHELGHQSRPVASYDHIVRLSSLLKVHAIRKPSKLARLIVSSDAERSSASSPDGVKKRLNSSS
ncbi:hypothetical protein LPU83_pLPU83c_0789 (plasmid) [Rhizobium favelukesii]|uniref:Uncharacterized protein n=1 Tax=Rhizobium favelukesii TaxID=348824 RepID=W6S4Z1_9HYPH|nr:hypothetical protein LPU83_pLPU83c_0789 [Rhizobium favelukesii]